MRHHRCHVAPPAVPSRPTPWTVVRHLAIRPSLADDRWCPTWPSILPHQQTRVSTRHRPCCDSGADRPAHVRSGPAPPPVPCCPPCGSGPVHLVIGVARRTVRQGSSERANGPHRVVRLATPHDRCRDGRRRDPRQIACDGAPAHDPTCTTDAPTGRVRAVVWRFTARGRSRLRARRLQPFPACRNVTAHLASTFPGPEGPGLRWE